MKVLLVGAAGSVGRAALEVFGAEHDVVGFDVNPVPGADNVIVGDLTDYASIAAAVRGVDAVVNMSMAPTHMYAPGHPGGFDINVRGFYNLLTAAQEHGVKRIVHTSSGAVHTGYPADTYLTGDLVPLKASNPYALTKILQEDMCRYFVERHGMSIICIRPWAIVDTATWTYTGGGAAGDVYFGTIDRHDVARALLCALHVEGIDFDCFYVFATPEGYARADVERTERILGWKPRETFADRRSA